MNKHQGVFDLKLFDLLNQTTQTHVYQEYQFYESRDAILEIIKQPGARIIVHNRYFGPVQDGELEFLEQIAKFYKTNIVDSKLIFISSFDIPAIQNINNIHFFYFPEYHAYYYPLYKDFKIRDTTLTKKFLSLNKRGSEHRQMLYRAFYHYNWLNDSYFSYLCETGHCGQLFDTKKHELVENILTFWEYEWPELAQWTKPKEKFITLKDDILNSYQAWSNGNGWETNQIDPSWLHSTDLYANSFCSVVVETSPSNKFVNISEKTIRALCFGHPIIFIAAPGTVQFLKTLNFDTFDDLLDHSYDTIADHRLRMLKSVESIDKINNFSFEELSAINQSLRDRRQHNIDVVKNLYNSLPLRSLEILEAITKLIPVQTDQWIDNLSGLRISVKY